jgi:sulfite reductase alpha subunit-like flavoprotein
MDSETSKEWDRISKKIDDELGKKNFSFKELDSEIKNKITRLAKFLDEFLEKNFSFEEVYKKKHEELINCIEKNLFNSAMPFLVDFSTNPDLAEKYKHLQNDDNTYAFANTCTILSIHELLRKLVKFEVVP